MEKSKHELWLARLELKQIAIKAEIEQLEQYIYSCKEKSGQAKNLGAQLVFNGGKKVIKK